MTAFMGMDLPVLYSPVCFQNASFSAPEVGVIYAMRLLILNLHFICLMKGTLKHPIVLPAYARGASTLTIALKII